jgi:hypothetical protein
MMGRVAVTEPGADARARRWALGAGAAMLAVAAVFALSPLGGRALVNDPGIYFHLSELTARGAVPLVDFEHGWNAGAWYYGALLYLLAGGSPDVWTYLWSTVTGSLLAGLAVLAAGWRLRLGAAWLLALVPATLLLTSVTHAKYAVPAVWFLALLPVGAARNPGVAAALRAGGAAVVAFAHVELGVLLATGTALYDLFGARDLALPDRLVRAAAGPAGLVAGLGLQAGVWALAGLAPSDFLRQLVATPGAVDPEFHFGYPLLAPDDARMLLYPVSLVVPFAPAVWRRLSSPTRLVAFLHLALGLVALRRTDAAHVAAASTLLAALVVLAARDLARAGAGRLPAGRLDPAAAAAFAVGAAWFGLAVALGFRLESLLAITALTLACLAGVAASAGGDRPAVSLGALAAAAVLLLVSLGGALAGRVGEPAGDALAAAVAEAVREPLERCTGGDPRVWVVPYPLGLYRELELVNPTPFVMFWYPFRGEHDRVRALVDADELPAILVFNRWPLTFQGLDADLERRYDLCAEVGVPATGDTVRIWTRAGGAN